MLSEAKHPALLRRSNPAAEAASTKSAYADFLQPAKAGFVILTANSFARRRNLATEQSIPL